ncbi:toxin-antitoxin system HicB family antitoxin [Paraburkholderia terrae]|uniref:toxin-antitoxin system HicB family antitoxin n=1 Tax=Paraburkholderia terrae TaxID=311230 RepID=UPI00296AB64D|nr:toxin-antitoxin system HicB family antitoxin [Paraburkholderia terrae]MDW3655493.1 toxin-antitoxin system HicB family antitoxin [Paraburkholderia terrae]
MNDPDRYPAEVFWSDEDEGFIAIAPDLPGCSAFGADEAEALTELKHAIAAWKEAAASAGNPIPRPSRPASAADYSGKFVVRMAKTMHRQLAHSAEREGVSLNQYVVTLLATYNGLSAVETLMRSAQATAAEFGKMENVQFLRHGIIAGMPSQGHVMASGVAGYGVVTIHSEQHLYSDIDIAPRFVNDPMSRIPFSPLFVSEGLDG